MPNQPKTPNRVVRVSDRLWESARTMAASKGETLADVIRRALERYAAGEP